MLKLRLPAMAFGVRLFRVVLSPISPSPLKPQQ